MYAIYAGTFDPITTGHLSIIKRCFKIYGHVLVVVAINPDKKPVFTPQERVDLINEWARSAGFNWAEIGATKWDGYVVDYDNPQAFVLVRGIRNEADFKSELAIADFNRQRRGVETIWLPAEPELSDVSSTQLKVMVEQGLPVDKYCTTAVRLALQEKLGGR